MNEKNVILVVDDLPANIGKLVALLGDRYIVKPALSGKKALEVARSNEPPDLILLDAVMPEMNGLEVCRTLKSDPETADIPIIFVTSLDGEEEEERGLKLGAVDYITKPFRGPIVLARVETQLRLKEYNDLLKQQSTLDGLTGLPNRRALDERLLQEWRRGARLKTPLSAILLDIDYFKQYNDHYGHLAGDDCLRQVGRQLSEAGRVTDFVARYGGEEFVCLLPHTDAQGALEVAEKFRKAVGALQIEHEQSNISSRLTVSQGVATTLPELDRDPSILLGLADEQLYRVKEGGRDGVSAPD